MTPQQLNQVRPRLEILANLYPDYEEEDLFEIGKRVGLVPREWSFRPRTVQTPALLDFLRESGLVNYRQI